MRNHSCDILASELISLGKQGADLPPSWDGAKVTHLVSGPQGEFIGKMLPGKGLLLFDDLKNFGIRQSLPHVFEYSPVMRLRDILKSERGAITTFAELLTARSTHKQGIRSAPYAKTASGVTNRWSSTFLQAGVPAAGSYTAITGGAAHSQSSVGALTSAFTAPTNPDKAFLLSFAIGSRVANIQRAVLIDILVAAGNISATTNSPQTVNTTALTRNTSGDGVLMFFETTTTLGTGTADLTVNKYTNQAGTTLQSAPANAVIASSANPQISYSTTAPFFGLASGDYGVRSIEEVTFSSALSAGVIAAVLCKPIMWIPTLPAGYAAKRDDTTNINGAVQLAQTSGDLFG